VCVTRPIQCYVQHTVLSIASFTNSLQWNRHLTVQSDGRGLSTTDDDEAIEQLQTLTHTWPMSLHGDAWHRLSD